MRNLPRLMERCAYLSIIAYLAGGCGDTDTATPLTRSELSISLSSGELIPPFSPTVHDYELSAYSARVPASITVRGADARLLDFELRDGEPYRLPTLPITPGSTLSLSVRRDGQDQTYTIALMPKDLPAVSTRLDRPLSGELYVTPFVFTPEADKPAPAPFLLTLDPLGAVTYYRRLPVSGVDFKRHVLPSGVVRYSYQSNGDVYLLDEQLRPLRQMQLQATARHPAYPADLHDFRLLGEEHFLFMAYVDKLVDNVPEALPHPDKATRVLAAFVQEVQGGEVVFEWDSSEHPELYALSTDGNGFTDPTMAADYAHANSMEIDPRDGNLILSFRHLDAVLKVSHRDGTILWRLGGPEDSFHSTAEQRPSHQHFASVLPDGRLQLFDNGNARMESRVLTFGLDEAQGAITSFHSLPLGYFSRAMGSVQRIEDRLVVGLGAHEPDQPDVVEVDLQTGRHTLELTLPAVYYSYRALKF